MKPLAVASCWQVPNYGSVLQAYAAQAALDSLGVPNETLWYEPERSLPERLRRLRLDPARVGRRLARAADSAREARLGPGAAAGRAARAEALGKFAREYLRLSPAFAAGRRSRGPCRLRSVPLGQRPSSGTPPTTRTAFIRSISSRRRSRSSPGRRASGVGRLSVRQQRTAARFLRRFDWISAREESGRALIGELSGREVPLAADPVLLLPPGEWRALEKPALLPVGGYLLCYFLGRNPAHREFAARLREASGLPVAALPHLDGAVSADRGYADIPLYGLSPGEFLSLVDGAACVLTDSYHCTAFSALLDTRFYLFDRFLSGARGSTNTRLDTLLPLLGLEDRRISSGAFAAGPSGAAAGRDPGAAGSPAGKVAGAAARRARRGGHVKED